MSIKDNKVISGILEIGRGMSTVASHVMRSPVTLEYPEVMPDLGTRFHGRLALLTKSTGEDLCIGCQACARVCPCGDLIQIEMHRDEQKQPVIDRFTIDIGRCIFCGNCTEVCPTNCINMLDDFELADYDRKALVLDKAALSLSGEQSDAYRISQGLEPHIE